MTKKRTKVCYVLSYRAPDYIRTRVLVQALEQMDDVELYKAINTRIGFLRYGQTLAKVLYIRLRYNPDVYILGFRGQEIFWPVRLVSLRKKLIFDEFVNMYSWIVEEKKIVAKNSILARLIKRYNSLILNKAGLILEDTNLSAEYSSRVHHINLSKYSTVYVGADESVFHPMKTPKKKTDRLEVFFYGTMLPLHGIEHILAAAELLKSEKLRLTVVGGGRKKKYIEDKIKKSDLNNIRYFEWVEFSKIPTMINDSDICLGGPFGDTSQAARVITGKTFQFLAMGKPIIASKTENIGFVDKKNIIFCERGSAKSLAEALKWALDNRNKLEDIGRNGARLYKEKFSEKQIKVQVEKVI